MEITKDTKVGEILERYPETLEVFLKFGFTPLKNKAMREKIAGKVSLSKACLVKSVPPEQLIEELKQAINRAPDK